MDIYQLGSPRAGISLGLLGLFRDLLFLSYRYQRLGWLYRKFPVIDAIVTNVFYYIRRN